MHEFVSDEETRFCVTAGHHPDIDEYPIERYFSDLDAAKADADVHVQFKCVWLSEIGTYRTRAGSDMQDWMIFWWRGMSDWGYPDGRGVGRPSDHSTRLVEYDPLKP